jgi:hypothetical protein
MTTRDTARIAQRTEGETRSFFPGKANRGRVSVSAPVVPGSLDVPILKRNLKDDVSLTPFVYRTRAYER